MPNNIEDKSTVKVLMVKHPDAIIDIRDDCGNLAITINRADLLPVCDTLKNDPALDYKMLVDVCGVDYLGKREERFDAVYHLYSLSKKQRVRIKVPLMEEDAVVSSVTGIWKGANWFEREAYDMFGIQFKGHPNHVRILCHEHFEGHALRKDHDAGKRTKCTQIREYLKEEFKKVGEDRYVVNIGPSHPAMHGTLRIQTLLNGEIIEDAEAEIGYLHRCFEKMCETHTYHTAIPYTDRLNYCSSFMNNVGYAMAIEKLMGVEVTPRAISIRVILSEFSRMMDHMVCLGANLVDLGALTNFWYFFKPREDIYGLIESCCGSRLTTNYVRIGGLAADVPQDFLPRCKTILSEVDKFMDFVEKLNNKNVIFHKRTRGVGVMSREDAIEYGWTGPCLRASGVDYDVRKDHPYYGYEKFDFEVPVGKNGDTYDRYIVRIEEIKQSAKIIKQALQTLPSGSVNSGDKRVELPPKEETYSNIESLMNHFKLVMHGIQPAPGEIYSFTEAANGELGFYMISDGTKNPYRVKVRPPCFAIFQAFPEMLKGKMISDLIAVLGSLNIIAGELDR